MTTRWHLFIPKIVDSLSHQVKTGDASVIFLKSLHTMLAISGSSIPHSNLVAEEMINEFLNAKGVEVIKDIIGILDHMNFMEELEIALKICMHLGHKNHELRIILFQKNICGCVVALCERTDIYSLHKRCLDVFSFISSVEVASRIMYYI